MCRFQADAPACTPCVHYFDCWSEAFDREELPSIALRDPRTDTPYRPIIPRSRHRKRRDRFPRGASHA